MYGRARFKELYKELVNPDDDTYAREVHNAAVELVHLLAHAFFVEYPSWADKPALVDFTLSGRQFRALEVGLLVDIETMLPMLHRMGEHRSYTLFEYFLLEPAHLQPASIAHRVTFRDGSVMVGLTDLRQVSTDMLRQIEAQILVKNRPYATLHNELRSEATYETYVEDYWEDWARARAVQSAP